MRLSTIYIEVKNNIMGLIFTFLFLGSLYQLEEVIDANDGAVE